MNKMKKWTTLTVVVLTVLALFMTGCGKQAGNTNTDQTQKTETSSTLKYQGQSLIVYSGAGISKAMDEIGQVFEKKTGAKINYNYAGCAQLLSQMEINKQGDVFVGGSLNDMNIAQQKGFTDKYVSVAYHIPAIAVPKGNPAGIKSLADMAGPGIKLILGDDKVTAIGKKGAKIFAQNNLQAGIEKNVVARAATVNEIVTKVGMKQADAGLVFEDNGADAKDIEIISIPQDQNMIDEVPVCVLSFTKNTELAQDFVDFVVSDAGKAIFAKHGFKTIDK